MGRRADQGIEAAAIAEGAAHGHDRGAHHPRLARTDGRVRRSRPWVRGRLAAPGIALRRQPPRQVLPDLPDLVQMAQKVSHRGAQRPGRLRRVTLPLTPQRMLFLSSTPIRGYVQAEPKTIDELNRRTRFACSKEFVSYRGTVTDYWFDPGKKPEDSWEKSLEGIAAEKQRLVAATLEPRTSAALNQISCLRLKPAPIK